MIKENLIDEHLELIEESNLSLGVKLHLADILADSAKKQAQVLFPIGSRVRVTSGDLTGQTGIVDKVKIKRVNVVLDIGIYSFPFSMLEPMEQSVQV